MIDMRIDIKDADIFHSPELAGLTIVLATAAFSAVSLIFSEPSPIPRKYPETTDPTVIKYLSVPEPQPIRPSSLFDWPLTQRMVQVDEEPKKVVEAVEREPEPEVEESKERKSDRHRRHRHRRHRY